MRVIVIGDHGRTGKLVAEKLVKARHAEEALRALGCDEP